MHLNLLIAINHEIQCQKSTCELLLFDGNYLGCVCLLVPMGMLTTSKYMYVYVKATAQNTQLLKLNQIVFK